ncbi:hypothetical protein F4815DRAFT_448188 [Daldinia loculata]|uniref:uncharacterized protein n=1 Tax=Daldinia loculata TaxID=103429 RepID=UPI0020C2FDCC|nr:uncharacterized protein F4817DRAFT_181723 [Daldinia loculata]KAI1651324.1 hypothetical protein F4817DRAFT_181723 [Daldinia loculata]KAI2777613.1 hypothetical protein F4815DRAFT_448188 [Daldinia loculata]
MSRRNSCVSDDNGKPRSRTTSQRSHKSPHQQPRSPRPSSHNKSSQNPTNSQAHNPSPLKMVTTTSTTSHHHGDETLHYYLPDTNTREAELQKQGWMEPIVIDDEDLMFSGKSLSAWYEEERKSISSPAEEERRGRQRVRQHNSHTHHHNHHNHHRHHPSSTTTSGSHEQNKH